MKTMTTLETIEHLKLSREELTRLIQALDLEKNSDLARIVEESNFLKPSGGKVSIDKKTLSEIKRVQTKLQIADLKSNQICDEVRRKFLRWESIGFLRSQIIQLYLRNEGKLIKDCIEKVRRIVEERLGQSRKSDSRGLKIAGN